MKRFRGGLVFKAHRLAYHPTLGWRVKKKKKKFVKLEDDDLEARLFEMHLGLCLGFRV